MTDEQILEALLEESAIKEERKIIELCRRLRHFMVESGYTHYAWAAALQFHFANQMSWNGATVQEYQEEMQSVCKYYSDNWDPVLPIKDDKE